MDYGWMSHALMWFVGALTAVTAVATISALFVMGRNYDN